ncbi:hypothetical protein [Allorhizocola rhizosphaerae]|uniref:hypothetical protein n=1 Tax=Allorhizocola rhizosphaerae TaxID=1872709 RepID=UPI0013C32E21|nr:hypothetical protein [Allorhizocola rhizosphaerae]
MATEDGSAQELVIAIVAPIGTNTEAISAELVNTFHTKCGYQVEQIPVSSLIGKQADVDLSPSDFEDERIKRLIEAGNSLCQSHGDAAAVAQLVIAHIQAIRLERTSTAMPSGDRRVFIVRSLKRPKEVELLRDTYGRSFSSSPRRSRCLPECIT